MKWCAVFFYALGFACACAQTTAPDAVSPAASPTADAPAAEPLSTTKPDNTRYLANPDLLTDCQARLSAFNTKPCDVIFIGDTLTVSWLRAGKALWNANYVPKHALNFGVDGDKTQNVLWRLNNMEVQSLKPKAAVVLTGTYNTANTAHEIADGVKAILANTQAMFPGIKIILVSIPPNEKAEDLMKQSNSLIRSYADSSSVYYIDIASAMTRQTAPTADGKIDVSRKGIGADHLVPDAKGYGIWSAAMDPILNKILSGK